MTITHIQAMDDSHASNTSSAPLSFSNYFFTQAIDFSIIVLFVLACVGAVNDVRWAMAIMAEWSGPSTCGGRDYG